MFAADPRVLSKIQPTVRRTLIVDSNPAAGRLLTDLLKGLGARDIVVEGDQDRAFDLARDLEPGLILTDRAGPKLDGEAFAKRIRRSNMACRRSPIIMVTGEATASAIKGARDAGVHEFLRKPFTSGDLFKRVENVALKSRDWIEGVAYVGPDRRRFNSGDYSGPQKRQSDRPASEASDVVAIKDQAMRILAAAATQFDNDPAQALRAIRQQGVTLKALAIKTGDAALAIAAAGLESTLAGGATTKLELVTPIRALLALADPQPVKKAG